MTDIYNGFAQSQVDRRTQEEYGYKRTSKIFGRSHSSCDWDQRRPKCEEGGNTSKWKIG